jgi:Ner family transcriptional regulator
MNKQTECKKTAPENWHRADIVAALHKAGWSLRKLAIHHDYSSPTTLAHALDRPWPKGERLIAAAIGIDPAAIWPSRYAQNYTQPKAKDSTLQGVINPRSKQCKSQAA